MVHSRVVRKKPSSTRSLNYNLRCEGSSAATTRQWSRVGSFQQISRSWGKGLESWDFTLEGCLLGFRLCRTEQTYLIQREPHDDGPDRANVHHRVWRRTRLNTSGPLCCRWMPWEGRVATIERHHLRSGVYNIYIYWVYRNYALLPATVDDDSMMVHAATGNSVYFRAGNDLQTNLKHQKHKRTINSCQSPCPSET